LLPGSSWDANSYRERGHDVAVRPRGPELPDFLVRFQPDLMAAEPLPLAELQGLAQDGDRLLREGERKAAFLLLWSALEGSLRLLGRRAQLPLENLPSSALIRELYSAGEISRDQFETLMRLLPVRNHLAHGPHRRPDEITVEPLQGLVRALLEEARSAQPDSTLRKEL